MKKIIRFKITTAILLFYILIASFFYSCTPQDELFTNQSVELNFSDDVLIFDTVFAGIRNTTQRLYVRNPSGNAVLINRIGLGNSLNPAFSITVNGKKGINFENVEILGKDSLLVLIEAQPTPNNQNKVAFIFDSLSFTNRESKQVVKLLVWRENANFISKKHIANTETWTKDKAYVLLDTLFIDNTGVLNIQDSVRIYAFNNVSIQVKGKLNVQGTTNKPVSFAGFRREFEYENRTGQWQGISILGGGSANVLYALIKNAVNGIKIKGTGQTVVADLVLKNTLIQNMSASGILLDNAFVQLENCQISNCVSGSLSIANGGRYELDYCTLANYEFDFSRSTAGLVSLSSPNTTSIRLRNSIVWGNRQEEIALNSTNLNLDASYSFLKTQNQTLNQNQNKLNIDPLFVDASKQKFQLKATSTAIGKALFTGVLSDLTGKTRDANPDIGAYEFLP